MQLVKLKCFRPILIWRLVLTRYVYLRNNCLRVCLSVVVVDFLETERRSHDLEAGAVFTLVFFSSAVGFCCVINYFLFSSSNMSLIDVRLFKCVCVESVIYYCFVCIVIFVCIFYCKKNWNYIFFSVCLFCSFTVCLHWFALSESS